MFFLLSLCACFENDNPLRMWYSLPATKMSLRSKDQPRNPTANYNNNIWQQNSIPIGNGHIGANVFGEIKSEALTFNEISLWEGGPSPKRPNYNGGNLVSKGQNGTVFRKIQQLFADGKDSEASSTCDTLVGDSAGYGSYIEMSDISIEFDLTEKSATNYVRYLDLDQGIHYVQYEYEGATLTREYFASNPDDVIVIRVNSSTGTIPKFVISLSTKTSSQTSITTESNAATSSIKMNGKLNDNDMLFTQKITVVLKDGTATLNDGKITISDSSDATIYTSATTDYKDVHPHYRTGEDAASVESRVDTVISKAVKKGYSSVRSDHIKDYTKLFGRVSLNLNNKPSTLPTNEQLAKYKAGKGQADQDRDLEVLLFQFGRYLQIGSSRENGKLPANLQGLWNDLVSGVPWSSDYHLNINLQMNYWPTYITNLAECAIPLINYVEGLRIPGRITAAIYAGVQSNKTHPENGFMAHTQNTPFGWTCPGWAFSWGWSPAAVPWILQNVFDYYLYTKDEDMLRNTIYPMMKEEAIFYDQIMVYNKVFDRLVSSPTYSPEQGPRTAGNAYEQELIWQHYHNTIKAAQILNVDKDLITKWNSTIDQLKPIEIGDSGQIKEWYQETYLGSIGSKGHRHMSHLLGLYPGDLISTDNKEWMDAALVSLLDRGDVTTGWGMGQRINAWSRTGDGNHAHTLIKNLFKNGIYNNLWDLHPPFQIDGNFGATSGMAEMLLQSNQGYINILPSLPDVWDQGEFDGLVARGNIVVGVTWANKAATKVRLEPRFNGDIIVQCGAISKCQLTDKDGKAVSYSVLGIDKIVFSGVAGQKYTATIPENRRIRYRLPAFAQDHH